MDIDKEIERAVKRVKDKRRELTIEEWGLHALRCQKAGIQVGDVVRSTREDITKDNLYRVFAVDFSALQPDAKPWVRGNPQSKDGTKWGKREVPLFDEWVRVDPDKEEA